jgi:hypothetical protein
MAWRRPEQGDEQVMEAPVYLTGSLQRIRNSGQQSEEELLVQALHLESVVEDVWPANLDAGPGNVCQHIGMAAHLSQHRDLQSSARAQGLAQVGTRAAQHRDCSAAPNEPHGQREAAPSQLQRHLNWRRDLELQAQPVTFARR